MIFFRKTRKSKKIAFCMGHGCGLGNFIQALPAVQALFKQGHVIDLFISAVAYSDIIKIVCGQPYIRHIYENTYINNEGMYDICIISFLSDHRVENAIKYIKLKKKMGEGF
jgi:hypothetical protein